MAETLGDAFVVWINSFDCVSESAVQLSDLRDGVALYEVMAEIARSYFDINLVKRKVDDNWRLQLANLKKLLAGLEVYCAEELNFSTADWPLPDPKMIVRNGDMDQLLSLIKLILACVINCNNNEEYISAITSLDLQVQNKMMNAIQEVMRRLPGPPISSSSSIRPGVELESSESHDLAIAREAIEKLNTEVGMLMAERDTLSAMGSEMESELALARDQLTREKERADHLDYETAILRNYDDPSTPAGKALNGMKKQYEAMKEDLESAERQRDAAQRERVELQGKLDWLHRQTEGLERQLQQAVTWRDDVELLRSKGARAEGLEKAAETYRAKLAGVPKIKGQIKELEETNNALLMSKSELESVLARHKALKDKLDISRVSQTTTESSLVTLANDRDQAALEATRALTQVEGLRSELQAERDAVAAMRDRVEELELQAANQQPNTDMFKGNVQLDEPVFQQKELIAELHRKLETERSRASNLNLMAEKHMALIVKKDEELHDVKHKCEVLALQNRSTHRKRERDLGDTLQRIKQERDKFQEQLGKKMAQALSDRQRAEKVANVVSMADHLDVLTREREKDVELAKLNRIKEEREQQLAKERQTIVMAFYNMQLQALSSDVVLAKQNTMSYMNRLRRRQSHYQ